MFLEIIKKPIRFLIYKYWRIIYKFKYDIPFFDKHGKSKIVNPVDYLEGTKSIAIIGKGASIFENNPKKIIDQCDCKVILSRVDIENLEEFIGSKFDIQIAPQVSKTNTIMQVLPEKLLKKYGIKLLICNLDKQDERFKIFYNFFHNRVNKIGYMPNSDNLDFDVDVYKYSSRGSLTIASSVLRMIYNVKTVEKIVFAGVDAYHFGYSQKQNQDGKVFFNTNITSHNPKETHGKPFIKFMIDSVIERNKQNKLKVFFPKILKKYITFPEHESFMFY